MAEASRKRGAGEAAAGPAARAAIRERVLGYFQKNAQAMDSVEGIARFWVHEDRSVVEQCLRELHEAGMLTRRPIAGTDFYSLQPGMPVSTAASASSAVAAPAAEVAAAAGTATGRILVVDDDDSVRGFMGKALKEVGHVVVEAGDGARAIQLCTEQTFDLVVTDVRMPGMSGLEVLKAVKQGHPETEVIVVTAHATVDTAITALRDGAYDFITKPLPELESLYRVVGRALEKRRLSQENRLLVENIQARNVELKETVSRFAAVNEIGKATTGLLDMEALFDALVRLVAQHLKARRVSVLVADPDSSTMTIVASVGLPENEAQGARVRVGEGIAGKVAAAQSPLLVKDIEQSDLKGLRTGGRYATASFMISPLMVSYPIRYQRRRIGVINVSDKHTGEPFNEQDLEFLSTLSSQVAVAIENARLVREMEEGYLAALVAMIQAAEDARPETRGHSRKVAELAVGIGRAMGLPESRVTALGRAAALHEVGRLASWPRAAAADRGSDGASTMQAWNAATVMATERLLAPIASLRTVREIILQSTSWFDAPPVPFGNDHLSIPIEARILSICEDFARLTGGNGVEPERRSEALEVIRQRAGRKHDPEVVEAMLRVVEGGSEAGDRAAKGGRR